MRRGPLHWRITRKAVPVSNNQSALTGKNGRRARVCFKWTFEISGVSFRDIVAICLLVLVITSALESLLALVLVGLHLCPMSLATELFRQCEIGSLSSGVISVLLGHRSRR
jgi:hypothetical protein